MLEIDWQLEMAEGNISARLETILISSFLSLSYV